MADFNPSRSINATLSLRPEQWDLVGAKAAEKVLSRIKNGVNSNDAPAKPYSPRGPIYVPNTGVAGRTKTALRGREVLTRADRGRLRGNRHSQTRSGFSTKFPNYSAYKQSLGKSGQRDLELSGRMLGSIAIVERTELSVSIGFTREEEQLKMKGNDARDPVWAFSQSDQQVIGEYIESLVIANLDVNL